MSSKPDITQLMNAIQQMTRDRDINSLSIKIVGFVKEIFRCEQCSVFLMDDEGIPHRQSTLPDLAANQQVELPADVIHQLRQTPKPLWLPDPSHADVQKKIPPPMTLMIPMTFQNSILGILACRHFQNPVQEIPEYLLYFADQAGVSIENIRHIKILNQIEQKMRESEDRYRRLFDMESDAIFVIRNEDGQILAANHASSMLYGYTQEELLTKKNTDLSAEPEETYKATHEPFPTDQIVRIPLRYHRKKDGTVFPLEITARFFTWEGQSSHLAAIRDITEHKRVEEELARLASIDALTGIYNRRYFFKQAEQIFNRSTCPPCELVAMMIDVDHFKNVNDRYGHATGDNVLREVALRQTISIRPTDLLGRYGGEEFVILLPRTSWQEAKPIADRLIKAFTQKPIQVETIRIPITISIGIACIDPTVTDLDTLLNRADQALYISKQKGRNCWNLWVE